LPETPVLVVAQTGLLRPTGLISNNQNVFLPEYGKKPQRIFIGSKLFLNLTAKKYQLSGAGAHSPEDTN